MRVHYKYKSDDRDYPLAGPANYDALSAEHVDSRTVKSHEKRAGKTVGIAVLVISPDGRVLTIKENFSQVLVSDRQ